jgi:hypothetical protein
MHVTNEAEAMEHFRMILARCNDSMRMFCIYACIRVVHALTRVVP